MRKKLFLFLVIIIAVAVIFAACKKDVEDGLKNDYIKLTINGTDVSEYTVVFAKSEADDIKSLYYMYSTEYQFYKRIAVDISNKIQKLTGAELNVVSDSSPATKYEILVGPTNREESLTNGYDDMSVYNYLDNVLGDKLVIGAGYISSYLNGNTRTAYCHSGVYHAFDALERYINDKISLGEKETDLAAGFSLSGQLNLKTVAMIGDSITEGVGSSNSELFAYPAFLQRILWKDYVIINLGNSGRTMRDDHPDRYIDTLQYAAALRYADKFDLVTIMLGTNDSNRYRYWGDNDDKVYNRCALEIATSVKNKNPNVKFLIMNCPAYYGTEGSGSPRVCELQAALPALFEQNEMPCAFFDMRTFTDKILTVECFPDRLHPNDEGYYLIAQKLSKVIPETFDYFEKR